MLPVLITQIFAPKMWFDISKDSDFSLHNIPFGVCSVEPSTQRRCVTAVGDKVVDLSLLQDAGAFNGIPNLDENVFSEASLDAYMAHEPSIWPQVRQRIINLFDGTSDLLRSSPELQKAAMHDIRTVKMHLPCTIGDYTDFYSSREHATNVGIMFRGKENALQPNWLHLPVGYHGRSSTVQVSGEPIVRPCGQLQMDAENPKKGSTYGPCRLLDFELEMAFFVGGPPNVGPMSIDEAKKRIFGFCLMNDWSARDIQKWEYVPLGPFTAKNFATSISPWIVPTKALEPFKRATSAVVQDNPVPLEYLRDPDYSSYDIQLSVAIQSEAMEKPTVICKSNFTNLYWNAAQQLVHHSVTGCKMNPGDLLASGTISGQTENAYGSMLELSWKGTRTIDLGGGEERKFLQDGDLVIVEGFCAREDGNGRVGFGVCSGRVLPAKTKIPPVVVEGPPYIDFKVYGYWRSSSSWRARIALTAKGVPFEVIPVDLKAGEQKSSGFLEKNPLGKVPVLEYTEASTGCVKRLSQSIAIFEFLDAIFPHKKSLIPKNPIDRVVATEMVQIINSDIQPLQNAPLLNKLERDSNGKILASDFAKNVIQDGLAMVATLIQKRKTDGGGNVGPFSMGSFSPTVVDACLIPQLFNARRWGVDVEKDFPELVGIEKKCSDHPWFVPTHASKQIDAEI